MTTPTPAVASPPRTLPPGQTETHFNTAYVEVEQFVFDPTLVLGFLHRPATAEGSVPVTEVLYGSHHVPVEDPDQKLFLFLRREASPQKPKTTT